MKAFKSIKLLTLLISLLSITVIFSSVNAQEYDDMYFSKSDRKTVKVDKAAVLSNNDKNNSSASYKEITKSTETYSAKNVNPEYIARYKSTESNEVNEQTVQKNDSYNSKDYFVEGYDNYDYISDSKKGEIDYAALNKRDQMSAKSNYNRPFSSPSWRFSPYMSMGYGYPSYGRYGYDPFMMGYGSGLTMGIGFGSGFGYSPSMSYSLGMSFGTGYNPWGGFGGYPGYYSPYGMSGFYDPWGSMYGYNPYRRYGYSPYYGGGYGYGGYCPTFVASSYSNNYGSESLNGRNIQYKPRTTRTSATSRVIKTNTENLRVSSSDAKIRVPSRTITSSASNGRISRDYSKVQNEYYSKSRRSSSSAQRISTSDNSRKSYGRSSSSASRYASSINNNKPSRTSNYSSGSNRNSSLSGYSSGTSRRSSSSSYSTPSRSSSSFSRSSAGSSGSRSSSYSSGSSSRSSSSSGTRSSSSSRSGRQ